LFNRGNLFMNEPTGPKKISKPSQNLSKKPSKIHQRNHPSSWINLLNPQNP
jgi:hypothetical protein